MILVMIIMLPKSKVPHEYLNFHTVMHQIKVAKPHSSADDSELKKLDCSMIQKVIQCLRRIYCEHWSLLLKTG